MGVGTFFRYIGSALLLTATALLIVASVSAPVVNSLSMLRVDLGGRGASDAEINFGTFGWCVRGLGADDDCSDTTVGYNIAQVITNVDRTRFSDAAENTSEALTNVMVLHPVGAGLFFIAFLLSIGTGVLISLLATGVTALGFLVTAVAVICDFVGLSIIRRRVRRDSNNNSSAHFGPAAWCVLAAAVLSLIAVVLVFITCCAGRRERKHRHQNRKMEQYHDGPAPTYRRRHFWQRRTAY